MSIKKWLDKSWNMTYNKNVYKAIKHRLLWLFIWSIPFILLCIMVYTAGIIV